MLVYKYYLKLEQGGGAPPENLGDVGGGGPHVIMLRLLPNRSFQGLGLVVVLWGCVRGRSIGERGG